MLLSFVTERLDEIDVQILIAGDQVPKALTADVKVKLGGPDRGGSTIG